MELLIESLNAHEGNIITEADHQGKEVFLNGVFMQAAVKNRNGRVYPMNEMIRAVETLNETIRQHGQVTGELDHPADRLQTELKYVSHVITEVRMDGNNAVGKMKILNTPYGLIAKELIKSGFRPGVSSRGAGNVTNEGIVENFMVQTVDIVCVPSAAGAMPLPVFESLQQMKSGIKTLTLAEQAQLDPKAQKFFVKEFNKFLSDIFDKK